ncbi:hypothetical protein [Nonomuraea rhodomycinica]|uniref:hypothetical protein n=1 Tax=Nonomuraea rhodomycinica TaxID=1712872 RepID=UPI001FE4C698|nr:hypothetical protein [Nonomuraea rhodomycinica]
MTRAKAWVVLVGRREALELAVHRIGHRRNTGPARRLVLALESRPGGRPRPGKDGRGSQLR